MTTSPEAFTTKMSIKSQRNRFTGRVGCTQYIQYIRYIQYIQYIQYTQYTPCTTYATLHTLHPWLRRSIWRLLFMCAHCTHYMCQGVLSAPPIPPITTLVMHLGWGERC